MTTGSKRPIEQARELRRLPGLRDPVLAGVHRDIAQGDDAHHPLGRIDDDEAPDLPLLHGLEGAEDVVSFMTLNDAPSHHIAHAGG
jgi:hypothetical protein